MPSPEFFDGSDRAFGKGPSWVDTPLTDLHSTATIPCCQFDELREPLDGQEGGQRDRAVTKLAAAAANRSFSFSMMR